MTNISEQSTFTNRSKKHPGKPGAPTPQLNPWGISDIQSKHLDFLPSNSKGQNPFLYNKRIIYRYKYICNPMLDKQHRLWKVKHVLWKKISIALSIWKILYYKNKDDKYIELFKKWKIQLVKP